MALLTIRLAMNSQQRKPAVLMNLCKISYQPACGAVAALAIRTNSILMHIRMTLKTLIINIFKD